MDVCYQFLSCLAELAAYISHIKEEIYTIPTLKLDLVIGSRFSFLETFCDKVYLIRMKFGI